MIVNSMEIKKIKQTKRDSSVFLIVGRAEKITSISDHKVTIWIGNMMALQMFQSQSRRTIHKSELIKQSSPWYMLEREACGIGNIPIMIILVDIPI